MPKAPSYDMFTNSGANFNKMLIRYESGVLEVIIALYYIYSH
jgi:hypothetical protein